jgi:hypothetical protein
MTLIERKWLGDPNTCTSSSTSVSSSSLGFSSFAGLFIITGSVSSLMLLICIGMFLYRERESLKVLTTIHQTPWEIIRAWFRHYDQVDRTSPTFREYVRSSPMSQVGNREGTLGQTGSVGLSSPDNNLHQLAEVSFEFAQGGIMPPSDSESSEPSNRGPTEEIELTDNSLER